MYSPTFTAQQIATVQLRLDLTLKPSSPQMVAHYCTHLDSLLDPQSGQLTRPLKADEAAWIRNECLLSALDFRYFAPRYWTIRTTDERLIKLNFNIAQTITLDIIGEMEMEELALHLFDLKARQVGKSTMFEAMIGHRALFYPNVNAIVASADKERSAKMADMIWLGYAHLPWWMMSPLTVDNQNQKVFGGHNSGISIQHGASVTGVARGTTPSVVHASELAYWDDPKESVDASMMKAIHDDPTKMVILESTADGMGNWWHKSWEFSVKNWPLRRSRFRPTFTPWFVDTEKYPTEAWLRKSPIPADWTPDAITVAHAESAAEYVHASDYLPRYLGKDWTMPTEQQWFWEVSRDEAKEKQELSQWYAEMPATPAQAFQASGTSPFEPETLARIEETMRRPWGVFGLIGDEIPSSSLKFIPWTPREIDRDRKPINITANWKSNLASYHWRLVPLKWPGWPEFHREGKIIVWEPPDPAATYGFGVDTAQGLGQDASAVEGLRVGSYGRPTEQILEFASSQLNADDIWPHCLAIGTWYSSQRDGRRVQPRFVIEVNKDGENTQNHMKKRGWRHFHDNRRYNIMRPSRSNRIGWMTVSWSRDMMFSTTVKALRDERWIINSPYFLSEMRTLSKDEYQQSLRAESGTHDDLYMAGGICYYSCWVLEYEEVQTRNLHPPDEIIYASFSNSQATAEMPGFLRGDYSGD